MKNVWFYLIVVAMVSIPVALLEVWGITHFGVGWGEPLPQSTFWGKQVLEKAPFNITGAVLLTRYHFTMYFVVVPAMLTTMILVFKGWAEFTPTSLISWIIFIVACVLGVMELEDFLFFVFSSVFGSPYPHALARFFRGEATWHHGWISFKCFSLPAFYILFPPAIALLLLLESRLEH